MGFCGMNAVRQACPRRTNNVPRRHHSLISALRVALRWATRFLRGVHNCLHATAASIAYLRQYGLRLWNLDDLGIFASLAEWTGRDADPCLELEPDATAVGEGAGMHPRRNRTRNTPFATKWGRRV
eukprot:5438371-Prymnesium_polylepis.2